MTSQTARYNNDLFYVIGQGQYDRKQTRYEAHSVVESSKIVLNSTNYQLLTTPLTLETAPGANKVLIPIALVMDLDYSSAAFNFPAGGVDLIYSTVTGTSIINIPQADINSASDLRKFYPVTAAKAFVINDSLALRSSANASAGGGAAYFRLIFSIQDFA